MRPSHIFVVGVHRSGTTLMRHILNDCPEVALCDETHFMGHAIPNSGMRHHFRKFYPLDSNGKVLRLVDHMYSEEFTRYSRLKELGWQWKWLVSTVDKETLYRALCACDRSEAAVFDVVMKLYAANKGKSIRGEKSPIHLRWAQELLEWYPNSKIVHMIRDPRAIHVSDLKRRMEQNARAPVYRALRVFRPLLELVTTLETTYMWRESIERGTRMSAALPDRYFLVRFEDLVRDPRNVVAGLCGKLGIQFSETMLQRKVVSAGFKKGSDGFDGPAASRWSNHLSPWAARWYSWHFGSALKDVGYE